jgi:hypothetical protein
VSAPGSNDSDHRHGPYRRVLPWLWLGAAATLLLFPIRLWTTPVGRAMLATPAHTVVDRADPGMAAHWALLERVAPQVPEGSTVTFVAANREVEMELYMLGLAVLGHARPLPASYYGQVQDDVLDRAEYLLVLGPREMALETFAPVADLGSALLLRRRTEER